nr:ABC transporter permease [Bacteroides sp.]
MLSFFIARRYLLARKSHNAVNIISMVALCGVAVAAMAMVAVMSVFNGFSDLAARRLSALDPPLTARPAKGKVIEGADSLAALIAALPEIEAAMPVVTEQGLAIYDDKQLAVTLVGVAPDWGREMEVSHIIIDGSDMTADAEGAFATLAIGPAVRLGAHPDFYAPLEVFVPRRHGRYNPANPAAAFRTDTLRVSAVYRTDQQEHDDDRIVMPLERLRAMLDYDAGEASSLQIIPAPGVSPALARRAVEKAVPSGSIELLDRMQLQAYSFRMIEIEKWISFLMLVFILVIASFNIISTLSLLIIEKEPSIAILNALGAGRATINRIFVIQGWLISLLGGIAGIVLGAALVLAQQWGGFIKLGGDPAKMSISAYPVRLDPLDLLWVIGIVAAVGLLTGLLTLAVRKSGARSTVQS